ncbi:MAG: lactate racemase domain-containing protein [Gemmataceae bacterium]|nr:lactate racemase domain-containing protein [Gemmataceae bacterium]
MDFLAEGSADTALSDSQCVTLVDALIDRLSAGGPLRRVLIIPPDYTRRHSGAGALTVALWNRLHPATHVDILPALGTHRMMPDADIAEMFPGIPRERFFEHDWRRGVVTLGEIPGSVFREASEGRVDYPATVQVNRMLVEGGYDRIISVGQLVPHEVVGIANHSKNVFIGVGGADLIGKSHYLGAVFGMERIMGRAKTPVRDVLDYAGRVLAPHLPLVYLLTVRSHDAEGRLVTRGLFAGDDTGCFERGAALSRRVNLDRLDRAPATVVVWLDPREYRSTWLGNKAIYRTRMAVADGGRLIVLAPGVREFGEQPGIDKLIRQYGYRGTPAILEAVRTQADLAGNLAAAAHLIHGSSEGRFSITYCPGGLTCAEIEQVGYEYGDLAEMEQWYNVKDLRPGWNSLPGGEVFFVSNPGLGLWGTPDRLGD